MRKSQQFGAAYLVVLFLIAAIAISLAVVSQHDATLQRREKERDWLFVGQQYQQAIKTYYNTSPDGIKKLPSTLEDLLLDKRFLKPVRHLRKLYLDPLTGQDWALIRNEENLIVGVYSTSQLEVLSQRAVKAFATDEQPIQTHADVKFIAKIETKNEENENGDEEGDGLESDDDAENDSEKPDSADLDSDAE